MHRKAPEGQILNFQNTFDRTCDEIRMEIQTENFFGSLISTKLLASHRTTKNVSNKENLHYYSTVNVGGYEPTKVVITLGRGVYTLHLYYYFVVHVHVDTYHNTFISISWYMYTSCGHISLHLYYYFVVHVHMDTYHTPLLLFRGTCTRGHISLHLYYYFVVHVHVDTYYNTFIIIFMYHEIIIKV
jgi:hypothetical protein